MSSINQEKIQEEILKKMYTEWFQGYDIVGLNDLANERQWDEREFDKAFEHLKHKYFIETVSSNRGSRITKYGILEAERSEIAPAELRKQSEMMRTHILDRLAQAWDEHGPHHHVAVGELPAPLGSDAGNIDTCLDLLREIGYIEDISCNSYSITPSGYECVQEWRKRVSLAGEYAKLSELTPQARGRRFQTLFARMLAEDGWQQEEGVRTAHEEMDVIIHRAREYYLIECKWEKTPIEASVIRELYGKLSNRVDVRGIVVSLSGFTSGAVSQTEDYAGARIILLFGKQDVENLIHQRGGFETMLSCKYDKLVSRREAVWA